MGNSLLQQLRSKKENRQQEIAKHIVSIVNFYTVILGEGDGTPLQYSCLENPMDGEAW